MEQIGIRELNQQTAHVIERVKQGRIVEITERGRPVARLVPASATPASLERLVAEGRATPPTITGPLTLPPTIGDPTVDSAETITRMRDDERW